MIDPQFIYGQSTCIHGVVWVIHIRTGIYGVVWVIRMGNHGVV